MAISAILGFFIGVITVIQSGLNRRMSMDTGLPTSIFIGGISLVVVSVVVYFAQKYGWVSLPENLRSSELFRLSRSWYLIPGVLGFLIVFGFPYLIGQIGAARVFVLAVAGQCLAGVLWDYFIEQNAPSIVKIIGVAVTMVGAILVNF